MSEQKLDKHMLQHLYQIANSHPKFYTQMFDLEEITNLRMDYKSNVPIHLETQYISIENDDINHTKYIINKKLFV